MGRPFYEYLDGKVYACRACHCHLASSGALLSKAFHSKSGRAYLYERAANTMAGPCEERMMTTGMHVVCDISCAKCTAPVGWRYEFAYEKTQKYKEGKVILERAMVVDLDHVQEGEEDLYGSDSDDGC